MRVEDKNKIIEEIDKEKAIEAISITHELLKKAGYKIISILFENIKEKAEIKQTLKEAHAAIDLARDVLMVIYWQRVLQLEVKQ